MVLAIIGLMTSAAVLIMPSADKRLETSLQETHAYMQAVSRESIVRGSVLGVSFDKDGYQLLSLSGGEWQPGSTAQKWQQGISYHLTVAGEDVSPAVAEDDKPLRPQLWFLPTGEQPAFDIQLILDGRSGSLSADGLGHMQVQLDG